MARGAISTIGRRSRTGSLTTRSHHVHATHRLDCRGAPAARHRGQGPRQDLCRRPRQAARARPRRADLEVAPRRASSRLLGPQRRRQVHDGQDPRHPRPGRHRRGARWPGSTSCADPDEVRRRIGLVSQKPRQRPDGHRAGEPRARRPHPGHADERDPRTGAPSCSSGSGSPRPPTGRPGPTSGGMARKLDVAIGLDAPAERALPRRADHRAGPRGPRRDVGARSRAWPSDEATTVLLTTHYLDEADHLADRLAIIDAGRVVVEGTPDELKGELRGDTVAVDVESHDVATVVAQRIAHLDGLLRHHHRGPDGAGPRGAGRPGRARRPRVPGTGRHTGPVRHAQPAVARRRLPAPRRARVREGGRHDRPGHPLHPADDPLGAPARPAAGVRRRHAGPAGDLAAPVRAAVQASRRHPGVRGRRDLVPGVPHARGRRHDGDVLGRLGRDGLHRRHEPRRHGPSARLAGAPRGDDQRHAGVPVDHHGGPGRGHRRPRVCRRRPVRGWCARAWP